MSCICDLLEDHGRDRDVRQRREDRLTVVRRGLRQVALEQGLVRDRGQLPARREPRLDRLGGAGEELHPCGGLIGMRGGGGGDDGVREEVVGLGDVARLDRTSQANGASVPCAENCQMPLCHMASLPDLNRAPSSWPPMSASVGMTLSVFALEISQLAASTPCGVVERRLGLVGVEERAAVLREDLVELPELDGLEVAPDAARGIGQLLGGGELVRPGPVGASGRRRRPRRTGPCCRTAARRRSSPAGRTACRRGRTPRRRAGSRCRVGRGGLRRSGRAACRLSA